MAVRKWRHYNDKVRLLCGTEFTAPERLGHGNGLKIEPRSQGFGLILNQERMTLNSGGLRWYLFSSL